MGKIQMSKGEPMKQSTTFLVSFTHSFNSAKKWLGAYCMGWARYDSPNSNWRSHHFLGNAFWLLGQSKTQKRRPFYHAFMFWSFPHHFSWTWALSRHSKLPVCKTIHVFGCYLTLLRLRNRFWWLSVAEFPSPCFVAFFSIVFKLESVFL